MNIYELIQGRGFGPVQTKKLAKAMNALIRLNDTKWKPGDGYPGSWQITLSICGDDLNIRPDVERAERRFYELFEHIKPSNTTSVVRWLNEATERITATIVQEAAGR